MTENAWNTDQLDANGELLIGNGSNPPTATTITDGSNCTTVVGANSLQFTYSGSTTGDFVLTHTASASGASEVVFTSLSSTYFAYVLFIDGYIPGTDTERLNYQLSTDNGSSYDTTSTFYFRGWEVTNTGTPQFLDADNSGTSNIIGSSGGDPGNATNESSSGWAWIYNPSASDYTRISTLNTVINSSGDPYLLSIISGRENSSAINAIRMFNSAGDLSGEFRLYGVLAS